MTEIAIRVGPEDFDLNAEVAAMSAGRGDVGGVVAFVGLTREIAGAAGETMTLEHYPGMTEKALRAIAEEAARRWPLQAVRIVHRIGALAPGERIVLAACAARHRGEAFESASFVMDYLKTRAPFWKKETGAGWVDARESDGAAEARWGTEA